MQRRIPLVTGVIAALLVVASCGGSNSATTTPAANQPGGSATTAIVTRTVDVTMTDLKFSLAQISVKVGETVRFVFQNQGQVTHEAVIGTASEQDAHEKEMVAMGSDMVMTDTPTAISVNPGKTGQLMYTFKTPGQLLIGCHEPGHYAAGMKIEINVA